MVNEARRAVKSAGAGKHKGEPKLPLLKDVTCFVVIIVRACCFCSSLASLAFALENCPYVGGQEQTDFFGC